MTGTSRPLASIIIPLLALLPLLAPLASGPTPAERAAASTEAGEEAPRILAAFGDVDFYDRSRANVQRAVAGQAEGFLGLGDYNYDAPLQPWMDMMAPLSSLGAWAVRGNHDDPDAFKAWRPATATTTWWSTRVGGARLIGLDSQESLHPGAPQRAWLVKELAREPADTLKVVAIHVPWWLRAGARYPADAFNGDPADMDRLMRAHGVDLVLAGHEHNYQRAVREGGVTYAIAGTGGRNLYPLRGTAEGTTAACACIGHLLIALSPEGAQGRFIREDGSGADAFAVSAQSAHPIPGDPQPEGNASTKDGRAAPDERARILEVPAPAGAALVAAAAARALGHERVQKTRGPARRLATSRGSDGSCVAR